ncbi:MAG: response regulator transcription factor, partial [Acidimicrobiales bacterium]
LRGSIPGVQVVMLSAIADEALAARAARAGCAAFLCKHQPLSDVVSALRAVGADGSQAPAVVQQNGRHPAGRLSKRESEVLELLAQGMGNKEIARELGLALNTVRNHVTRLLVKLGAHSRLEAVATAVRRRMIYR